MALELRHGGGPVRGAGRQRERGQPAFGGGWGPLFRDVGRFPPLEGRFGDLNSLLD